MKNIILLAFSLSLLCAQYQIEDRWHLVGYEDNVMYQFEDNFRYSIYSIDGFFGDIEDAGGTPNPYIIVDDIITIDLFFGNVVNYEMNYICDGEVVEFITEGIMHSTLFREGYNYNDCLEYLEDCCQEADNAINDCEGVGCYIPQCNDDCSWESMQCWGSTGYCWCVDESGIEIDGTSTPSWEGFPDCEEIEILECSEMNQSECYNNDSCQWIDDIEIGDCSDITNSAECYQTNQCLWYNAGNYGYLYDNCYGGTYEIDNSYCQETEVQGCEEGFIQINDLCFHEGDISVIQKMIDNSYQSNIDLDCQDGDDYCGSPNPFMDSLDNWAWLSFDGVGYDMPGNNNGSVEPLELGLQQWENGRLTSFMCGAYIYCQLSGPIPEEINNLTELETFRVEGNYFNGFIPESICDLDINYNNSLEFDVRYDQLCPPYPYCIDTNEDFWGQYNEECSEIGDVNYDGMINILDIISLVSIILDGSSTDYQTFIISDINSDSALDILDIIVIVNIILD